MNEIITSYNECGLKGEHYMKKDENYKGLCDMINHAEKAYLELDPITGGAKDLAEDVAKLYNVKNTADKNRRDHTYQMATIREQKVARHVDTAVKLTVFSIPWLIQTGWIVMAFVAEDGGKILTSKASRDFVFKLLKVKL